MKEVKELQISGLDGTFHLKPMPLLKGLKLCRKIETMIVKALKSVDAVKEPLLELILGGTESDVDNEELVQMVRGANIEKIMEVFLEVLTIMSDSEFEQFVFEMLSTCQYVRKGTGAIDFTEKSALDVAFGGNIASVYQVLYAIMEYNNFTPFAIAGIGNRIRQIGSSIVLAGKEAPLQNS